MREEDLEVITPQNPLQVIVKESNLEESKANFIFKKFATFFSDAELWAKKAKAIKVTDESQKVVMDQARQGRLFLRKIRIDIEKCRKELKEQSLREGKAIDKVAKLLTDTIEPIELYLDQQEHFVEHREAQKEAIVRAEIEKKMEEERLADERRKAEELEVTRRENEELRKKMEEERKKSEQDAKKAREESENKLAEAKRIADIAENNLRIRKQADLKAEADKIREQERLKNAGDTEKMQKFYNDLMAIEFPEVTSQEAKRIIFDSRSHIGIVVLQVKKYIQSNKQEEEY